MPLVKPAASPSTIRRPPPVIAYLFETGRCSRNFSVDGAAHNFFRESCGTRRVAVSVTTMSYALAHEVTRNLVRHMSSHLPACASLIDSSTYEVPGASYAAVARWAHVAGVLATIIREEFFRHVHTVWLCCVGIPTHARR